MVILSLVGTPLFFPLACLINQKSSEHHSKSPVERRLSRTRSPLDFSNTNTKRYRHGPAMNTTMGDSTKPEKGRRMGWDTSYSNMSISHSRLSNSVTQRDTGRHRRRREPNATLMTKEKVYHQIVHLEIKGYFMEGGPDFKCVLHPSYVVITSDHSKILLRAIDDDPCCSVKLRSSFRPNRRLRHLGETTGGPEIISTKPDRRQH